MEISVNFSIFNFQAFFKWYLFVTTLRLMQLDLTDDGSTFVQVMA